MHNLQNTFFTLSTNICKLLDLLWCGLPKHLTGDRVINRVVLYYTPDLQWISYMNYNFFFSVRLDVMRATLDSTSISIAFMKVYHSLTHDVV